MFKAMKNFLVAILFILLSVPFLCIVVPVEIVKEIIRRRKEKKENQI